MGRPREHDDATRTALLDAAEALLADGGAEAVSVRSVADHVGVTTRAVYSVFGSKAGLLEALAARGYRYLADRVGALKASDDAAADLVAVGLSGFRRFALERPHLFRLTFERVSPVSLQPSVYPEVLASYEALAGWIGRAVDAGVVAERPVVEIAFVFHSLCDGLASNELSREPPPVGAGFWRVAHGIDGEHLWRLALQALVAGLAGDGAGSRKPPSP